MKSILNNKVFLASLGLLLAVFAIGQERSLGSAENAWVLAIIIDIISGSFIEGISTLVFARKFNVWNLISWVVGGAIGIGIMFLV